MLEAFAQKVSAVGDYEVNIAVFCDDTDVAQNYVQELCRRNYVKRTPDIYTTQDRSEFLEGEYTGFKDRVILYDAVDWKRQIYDLDNPSDFTRYHTTFHVINVNDIPTKCGSLIKKCVGAIILYDISDPALQPIVENGTLFDEDLKVLREIDTPLNRSIKFLQGWRCNFFNGWNNALEFVTYNIENVEPDLREKRHEQINRYTCNLEVLYGIDNKWSRGHPDITMQRGISNPLSWIVGTARRRITQEEKNVIIHDINAKKKEIMEEEDIISQCSCLL